MAEKKEKKEKTKKKAEKKTTKTTEKAVKAEKTEKKKETKQAKEKKTETKKTREKKAVEEKKTMKKAKTVKTKKEEPVEEQEVPLEKESEAQAKKGDMLVEGESYLKSGAHIGARTKTGTMARFVYKTRKDGLKVMDVQVLDERIKTAASLISNMQSEKIAVVSRKVYGSVPVKSFAESIGAKPFTGRFIPGTFTNPECTWFFEPRLVLVTDPETDFQAITEAKRIKVPVIAFTSTNNDTKNIDLVIPMNNKGRKSLALVYWLLAREVLVLKEEIKDRESYGKEPSDYVFKLSETTELGGRGSERSGRSAGKRGRR